MKKSLLTLSIPIFLELLLATLLGNIDTLMISSHSQNAVAALGSMGQIINIQTIVLSFVSTGASILVAQYLGAKNDLKVRQTIGLSFGLNIGLGLLLGLIYFIGGHAILKATRLPEELIDHGILYFQIVAGFAVFQGVLTAVSAILRSHGFTKDILFINIGINLINVLGNGMFIFGWLGAPILGLTGVGISTTASRLIGAIFSIFYMKHKLKLKFKMDMLFPFPKDIFKNLLNIGLPSAGEHLAWQIAQVVILSMVNTMGIIAITARTYLWLISTFLMMFATALGMGVSIIVAQLVGAGKFQRAYFEGLKSLKIGLVLTFLITLVVAFCSTPILKIFSQDPEIISLGKKVLYVSLFLETGRAFNIIIIGALKAAGDTKFPMYLGFASMFGLAVTFAWLFGINFGWGLVGVWIGNSIDECVRGFVVLARWNGKRWKTKSFIGKEIKQKRNQVTA